MREFHLPCIANLFIPELKIAWNVGHAQGGSRNKGELHLGKALGSWRGVPTPLLLPGLFLWGLATKIQIKRVFWGCSFTVLGVAKPKSKWIKIIKNKKLQIPFAGRTKEPSPFQKEKREIFLVLFFRFFSPPGISGSSSWCWAVTLTFNCGFNFLFFFPLSLKRTTDMMFGGKQVVVCGYGEVRGFHFPNFPPFFPLGIPRVGRKEDKKLSLWEELYSKVYWKEDFFHTVQWIGLVL